MSYQAASVGWPVSCLTACLSVCLFNILVPKRMRSDFWIYPPPPSFDRISIVNNQERLIRMMEDDWPCLSIGPFLLEDPFTPSQPNKNQTTT